MIMAVVRMVPSPTARSVENEMRETSAAISRSASNARLLSALADNHWAARYAGVETTIR